MTTAYDQNKLRCEQEHGTAHLPAGLRDLLYRNAYEEGHAYGLDEVVNCYADFAKVALAAWGAARMGIIYALRYYGQEQYSASYIAGLIEEGEHL